LPDFVRDNPVQCADWNIFYDARGHLLEPHTGIEIPIGTKNVRLYIGKRRGDSGNPHLPGDYRYATAGPCDRFGTIIYIEKEGFTPLIVESGLLDEYDVALLAGKGMSTTAARKLLQDASRRGVKILCLHDFDIAGMIIAGTLSRDTARFQFDGEPPDVIDIGLRLTDVRELALRSERQRIGGDKEVSLRRGDATEEEISFLMSGQRVELNALGNDALVEWLRGKLEQHCHKVVPDLATLRAAYVEALRHRERVRLHREAEEALARITTSRKAPPKLEQRIREMLEADPSRPWDAAIWELAQQDDRTGGAA
jgi:hypothetical protein